MPDLVAAIGGRLSPVVAEVAPAPSILVFSAHDTDPDLWAQVDRSLVKARTANDMPLTIVRSMIDLRRRGGIAK